VAMDVFEKPPAVTYEAAEAPATTPSEEEPVFSDEELAEVSDRLSDLGYLQ
jgi:hypothetical protein